MLTAVMARAKVTALKLCYDGDDSNSNIGGGFNGDGVGDTNNKVMMKAILGLVGIKLTTVLLMVDVLIS